MTRRHSLYFHFLCCKWFLLLLLLNTWIIVPRTLHLSKQESLSLPSATMYLDTFGFRPHCGETGSIEHLACMFILA